MLYVIVALSLLLNTLQIVVIYKLFKLMKGLYFEIRWWRTCVEITDTSGHMSRAAAYKDHSFDKAIITGPKMTSSIEMTIKPIKESCAALFILPFKRWTPA